jgi:hypothetical protein
MFQLARWLVRHLDDPRLIIWIAERGGQMDSRWISLVDSELERLATLERDGKVSELDLIRLDAPKVCPIQRCELFGESCSVADSRPHCQGGCYIVGSSVLDVRD